MSQVQKSIVFLLVVAALVVGVVLVVVRVQSARAKSTADKGATERPVPVTVAVVAAKDVPITVEGLGTVTPLYTVTVKTLVDGRLDQVFYKEGQLVRKGDAIAVVDPRPFEIAREQAAASRAKDMATKRNADITLARDTELLRQGLQSQQQVDNDRAAVDSAAAAVLADEAQVHTAELNILYAHIASPIDGVTGIRLVDPGNIVHPADTTGLVVLTQLDPISVVFVLPEDDLPRVSASRASGNNPRVTALSRDASKELGSGELTVVDNLINQATATLKLKAVMNNPDRKLWPNQFVKARLLLDVRKNAIVVPATALQKGPKGMFVYVVQDDRAVPRDVAANEIQGDLAIVTSGVSLGDKVVTEGQAQLKPNTKVAVHQGGP